MRNKRFFYLSLAVFILASACQAGTHTGATMIPLPAATLLAPSPTSVLAAQPPRSTSPVQATRPPNQAPTHDGDPIRFTFPTPAPIPASRWRPPLYDVPWALGPHDHFFLTRPISADEVNWPEWDYRYGGVAEGKTLAHSGIDIAANRYTPVIAAGPGVVAWAGYGLLKRDEDPLDPYGLAVLIEHDFGYNGHMLSTVYGHMERVDVVFGQRVNAGQQLGIVGTTGNSTGPHLHFEVRMQYDEYGATRNPELWLSPPQGWGVLVARLMREDTTPLFQKAVFVRSLSNGRIWEVHAYGSNNIHYDDYYRESLVLSDLPAGSYEVSFDYNDEIKKLKLEIRPGGITYFSFQGKYGFSTALPSVNPTAPNWLATPKP